MCQNFWCITVPRYIWYIWILIHYIVSFKIPMYWSSTILEFLMYWNFWHNRIIQGLTYWNFWCIGISMYWNFWHSGRWCSRITDISELWCIRILTYWHFKCIKNSDISELLCFRTSDIRISDILEIVAW